MEDKKISNILLKGDYITKEDLVKANEFAKKRHSSTVDYFLSKGMIDKDLLGQAIAESFSVDYADLNSNQPSKKQVLKIPEEIARKFNIIIFSEDDKNIVLTTDNPKKTGINKAIKDISTAQGKKTTLVYSLTEDINMAFIHYRKALETRFSEIIKSGGEVAPEIIDEIIEDAYIYHASDIHFGPRENEVVVRFRVDGVLREAGIIPKEYYANILNKIKIDADLRIDKHFTAQDGAMRFAKGDKTVDMRISILPSRHGEKVVIRLLSEYVSDLTLSGLGLSPRNQKIITDASHKPFGMILVTGPTGSGKTTTLYAVLKLLNNPEVNITTIEDPVEYNITGGTQVQVNPDVGLTFAEGLRSIVRQDPDIILVGEIRDKETAEISVNASLTGHLLLSTFHANDASTAIPRLLDIGIEPFLLSSTLELIIAQRLVRRLCEKCRYSYSEKIANIEKVLPNAKKYFGENDLTLYKGEGCAACGGSGFKGRTAIMELISITPEMKDLILKSPSGGQIWELAKKQGTLSLFQDGVDKVKSGVTTVEELLRVAAPVE